MNASIRKEIKKRFGNIKIHPDGFDVKKARHRGPSGIVKPIVQDKPWGAEVWLVYTDKYALKIMIFEPGKRFSLQRHKKKEESWYVMKGNPQITLGKKVFRAKPGMVFRSKTGTVHRIGTGKKTAEVWEVSTPELDDVVHIEDDFGRV